MLEADSQHFASAQEDLRFKKFWPAFSGDHRGTLGGGGSQPTPPSPSGPPFRPPLQTPPSTTSVAPGGWSWTEAPGGMALVHSGANMTKACGGAVGGRCAVAEGLGTPHGRSFAVVEPSKCVGAQAPAADGERQDPVGPTPRLWCSFVTRGRPQRRRARWRSL